MHLATLRQSYAREPAPLGIVERGDMDMSQVDVDFGGTPNARDCLRINNWQPNPIGQLAINAA